jgi:hypothetical protein
MIAVVASLQGELVRLRPLRREDAPHLAEIGSHAEVARWWPDITVEELVAKAEGRDEVEAFAIEHDGELVGLGRSTSTRIPSTATPGSTSFSIRVCTAAASAATRSERSRAGSSSAATTGS